MLYNELLKNYFYNNFITFNILSSEFIYNDFIKF